MRATRLADDDLRTSNTSGAVRLRESLDHEKHLGIVSQSLGILATMLVDNCHCHNCDEQWPCFISRNEYTGYYYQATWPQSGKAYAGELAGFSEVMQKNIGS
jgi:hypothetical protein